jgi:hypothetical protein
MVITQAYEKSKIVQIWKPRGEQEEGERKASEKQAD